MKHDDDPIPDLSGPKSAAALYVISMTFVTIFFLGIFAFCAGVMRELL